MNILDSIYRQWIQSNDPPNIPTNIWNRYNIYDCENHDDQQCYIATPRCICATAAMAAIASRARNTYFLLVRQLDLF